MKLFYIFYFPFSLISLGLLFSNSILYPTFTVRYLNISSLGIFTIYSLVSLILLFFEKIFIPNIWSKINKNIVFPILLILNTVFIFLEKINYQNYILEHLHIFPYSFLYILFFSIIILYVSNFKEKDTSKRRIRLLFPILLFIFTYIWIEHYSLFFSLIKDDSLLEYSQFILYFLSAITSWKIFLIYKKDNKNKIYSLLFLLLSLGLFFVSFEEISWGQRIIGIKTPEKMNKINIQKETNIHNMFSYDINEIIYVLIGLYGIFSRKIITKFFAKKYKNLIIFTPSKDLYWYFLFVFLVYFDRIIFNLNYDMVANNVFRKYAIWDWLEISELYLAIAFCYYTKITVLKEYLHRR